MDSMQIIKPLITIFLCASVPLSVFMISYARKRKSIPGARYFTALMLAGTAYNITYIGELSSTRLSTALKWFGAEHLFMPFLPYFWLLMCLEYIRLDKRHLNQWKTVMLYYPITQIAGYFTNNLHHLYLKKLEFVSNGYFYVIETTKGPLYFFLIISATLICVVTSILYLRDFFRFGTAHKYGHILMFFTSLAPWATIYLIGSNHNYLGIDYTPLAATLSGVFYLFGIFQLRLFRIIPLATEVVFQKAHECFLLVDLMDHIIQVNEEFYKLYPELKHRPKHYAFADFIRSHPELQALNDENSAVQYSLETSHRSCPKLLYYSAELTQVTDGTGTVIGKILAVSDITLHIEKQKALETQAQVAVSKAEAFEVSFLQAQIKPHFINNSISCIISASRTDPKRTRDLLINLSDYLRSFYDYSHDKPAPFSGELDTVRAYVALEQARFGDLLNVEYQIAEPDFFLPPLTLQPLVENAFVHGIREKEGGGTITIYTKRLNNGMVRVGVRDNGPGIKEKKDFKRHGVAVDNINFRLSRIYQSSLVFLSPKGGGCEVYFEIPAGGAGNEKAEGIDEFEGLAD